MDERSTDSSARGAGHWRESTLAVLLVLAVLVALVAAVVVRPEAQTIRETTSTVGVITALLRLVAGFLAYFLWRLTSSRVAAWLTVAMVVSGVVGTAQAAPVLAPGELEAAGQVWAPLLQVGLGLALCWIVGGAQRRDLRGDPALVGLACGVAVAGLVLAAATTAPLEAPATVLLLLDAGIAMTTLALTSVLLELTALEPWVRWRLVAVVALLGTGQTATYFPDSSTATDLVVIVVDVLGAALLCSTALELLRDSVGQAQLTLDALADQLAGAEAEVRLDRARMHEIGSTVAGIASASQVIRDGGRISFQRRHLLEDMMETELGRLGRLVSGPVPLGPREFCVDDVVHPLVVAQQARGRSIEWMPSYHRAVGIPDEVSEVVHVLLENAARHGGGGPVQVCVLECDGVIEVVVSDAGSGVSPELVDRLFDWEVRSAVSVGQGIGLHTARNLMSRNAGTLELTSSTATGAVFVARLPSARPSCEVTARIA